VSGSEVGSLARAFIIVPVLIQQDKMTVSFLMSKGMEYSELLVLQRFDGVFCAVYNFLKILCALIFLRSEADCPDPGDLLEVFMIFNEVQRTPFGFIFQYFSHLIRSESYDS
jgi:hypothetical protein